MDSPVADLHCLERMTHGEQLACGLCNGGGRIYLLHSTVMIRKGGEAGPPCLLLLYEVNRRVTIKKLEECIKKITYITPAFSGYVY